MEGRGTGDGGRGTGDGGRETGDGGQGTGDGGKMPERKVSPNNCGTQARSA